MNEEKQKGHFFEWVQKNKDALLASLILLLVFTIAALREIALFGMPGFTWVVACACIFALELRNLKRNRAKHTKFNPFRQV